MPEKSAMKTAEEWWNEFYEHNQPFVVVVEKIQRDALEAALAIIKRKWTFDQYQTHTHSWHDMQDAMDELRSLIAEKEKER